MSLETRLAALVQAVGWDIRDLWSTKQSSYHEMIFGDGATAYYPLNEDAGATEFLDIIGGRSLIAVTGTPTAGAVGPFGTPFGPTKAVTFNGATILKSSLTNGPSQGQTVVTLEAMFYVQQGATNRPSLNLARGHLIKLGSSIAGSASGCGLALGNASSDPNINGFNVLGLIEGKAWVPSGIRWTSPGWHYAAMTIYDDGTMRFCLDGQISYVSGIGGMAQMVAVAGSLTVGGRQTGASTFGEYFTGRLANIAIYNSALSEQTMLRHAAAGSGYTAVQE